MGSLRPIRSLSFLRTSPLLNSTTTLTLPMPPKKRAAEDDGSGPSTRSAKAPKTEKSKARGGRPKRGPKTNVAASEFKSRALPIHINITHTPPILTDDGTVSIASTDPGFIGSSTLLPGTFATGSYGWKGNKRFTVELENPEGGEKEKVHVILTLNATVIGSKGAQEGDEGDVEEHAEEAEHHEAHPEGEGEMKDAAETEEALNGGVVEDKGE